MQSYDFNIYIEIKTYRNYMIRVGNILRELTLRLLRSGLKFILEVNYTVYWWSSGVTAIILMSFEKYSSLRCPSVRVRIFVIVSMCNYLFWKYILQI